jgi:hypothetical protein
MYHNFSSIDSVQLLGAMKLFVLVLVLVVAILFGCSWTGRVLTLITVELVFVVFVFVLLLLLPLLLLLVVVRVGIGSLFLGVLWFELFNLLRFFMIILVAMEFAGIWFLQGTGNDIDSFRLISLSFML